MKEVPDLLKARGLSRSPLSFSLFLGGLSQSPQLKNIPHGRAWNSCFHQDNIDLMFVGKPRAEDDDAAVNNRQAGRVSQRNAGAAKGVCVTRSSSVSTNNFRLASRGGVHCRLQLHKGVHLPPARNSRSCSCQRMHRACAREGVVMSGGWVTRWVGDGEDEGERSP